MTSRHNGSKARSRTRKPAFGLLDLVRHRSRRRKNLAELRALDAARLEDIGLSREARARLIA